MEKRKLSPDVIAAFSEMDTPSISDAMDRLGVPCGLLGIKPVVQGTKICGQAFTIHYTACGQTRGTVGDFIDDIEPGDVAVIDNGGRLDCTVWGDIMSIYAAQHKLGGTLIDGVCRDIPVIHELRYPIFTKGCYMVTGKDRVYTDYINEPVSICGIQVRPGDLIVADDSGAVAIPFELAEKVLQVVREIDEAEQAIVAFVKQGMRLKDAREKLHYHSLQTRRNGSFSKQEE